MIQYFKEDIFNSMFLLVKKTYLKVTGSYAIYFMLMYASVLILISSFVSYEEFASAGSQTPEEMMQFAEKLKELFFTPEFLMASFLSFLFLALVQSWNYNFAYNLSNKEILNSYCNFRDGFRDSFHVNVFKILGVSFLLGLVALIGVAFVATIAGISGFLTFLLVIALIIFTFRFFLIIPAIVVGNKTLRESFSFSFAHITWFRALKLFGFAVTAGLLVMMALFVFSSFSMFLVRIPVASFMVQLALQIFMGGFILAITVSASVALYYRYADDLNEADLENSEAPSLVD